MTESLNNHAIFPSDWVERVALGLAAILQVAIFLVIVRSAGAEQWLVAVTGSLVLALSFMPAIIQRQLRIQLPVEFTLVTCIFLYASFGLGEVRDFYQKFWWWDLMLHSFSALVIGLIGFLMIYVFYMTHRVRMAPIYVAMVSFGFAVTLGTVWEVFEFLMDQFFGFNMQKSGLVDTMTDLLVNIVTSLVTAVIGYSYVKNGDSLIAEKMIRNFVTKNPLLFRRRKGS